jgi:hypothetical protein
MKKESSKYEAFVERPRYGRESRLTGHDPDSSDPRVFIHWNSSNPNETVESIRHVLGWSPTDMDDGRRRFAGAMADACIDRGFNGHSHVWALDRAYRRGRQSADQLLGGGEAHARTERTAGDLSQIGGGGYD